MQAIIFANGEMTLPLNIDALLQSRSLVIAADGGMKNCQKINIRPQIIIGDLDSLGLDELSNYRENGIKLLQYPTRKNETDLELALQYTLEENIDDVIVFGALGARWDMTLANILLLANPKFDQLNIRLVDGMQEINLLKPAAQTTIRGKSGDIVSLIPLIGDAHGITTQGLEYPLNDEMLFFGATRGISNVMIGDTALVHYKDGLLLCVVHKDQ